MSLGKYQADSSFIFVTYEILGTTQIPPANTIGNLTDVFEVNGEHRSGQIYLNIDLREVNPLFDGSTVSGNLNFEASNRDKNSYSIGFKLFDEGAAGEESDERSPAPSFEEADT